MRAFASALCIGAVGLMSSWAITPDAQAQGGRAGRDGRVAGTRLSSPPSASAQALDHAARRSPARLVTLEVVDVPLKEVLSEIERQSGVSLVYSWRVVPLEQRVSVTVRDVSAEEALRATLRGTDIEARATADGEIVLAKRPKRSAVVEEQSVQDGAIIGRVTDARTADGVGGVGVTVQGTALATTTREDGGFRIARVPAGAHTVTARRLGYARASQQVTVVGDEEATVNFALEPSAGILDEVVVTGTVVPTEVKALPTPVSVISESDISQRRPRTVQEFFRQAVPGAVSWDISSDPYQTPFSVRGANTLSPNGTAQMKVFVDGVEASNPTVAAVDPTSIERVEVIRGPQAGAIYGSDAIGGVIQIFTKRGDPNITRPRVNAEAALGLAQTPYDGFGEVLRQEYKASVRGGGSNVGYNLGVGYTHTNDWIPNGELSSQSNPSVYGGMRFEYGAISGDISARYYENNDPVLFNPELFGSFSFLSRPFYQTRRIQNQTAGAQLRVAPVGWWRTTVTAGIDRVSSGITQSQPRLTTPGDTLLQLSEQNRPKKFVSINTSLQGSVGPSLTGSLTVGVDHYDVLLAQFFTSSALNTTGSIRVPPGRSITALRSTIRNTGYFAQVQIGVRDQLFLTGALRMDRNTEFGNSLDTQVLPRAGLSYVREIAGTTLKFRGSYGKAIRPPSPGQKLANISSTGVTLENPQLGPERQQGWDLGLDAVFGSQGSLSVTHYNQTAENLIQFVLVEAAPVRTSQNQNVGRVKNTGFEVEGTLFAGPLQFKGQYGYARARIEELGPNYTGDLRIGDQSRFTPKHTAGASLTFAPLRGPTITGGLTYVGSWNATDWLAQFGCLGQTRPCRASPRDYVIAYPDFVKVNASISQQITPRMSGFISVDNLTNEEVYELWNFNPVMGRISTIGVRFHY